MSIEVAQPRHEDFFQRAITAHLPQECFERLKNASVLVAGVGGGSNIAELLARKGVGKFLVADPDIYEPHNIRQRGSLVSTIGRNKAEVTAERLYDVNPYVQVQCIPEGITLANAEWLVRQADVVVDMIDLHAVEEKIAIHSHSRRYGKTVVTTPSAINGGVLWVFAPKGIPFEEFCGFKPGMPLAELAWRILDRMFGHFPEEAPAALYQAAARGERTIPLDAVGVDQASVMAVAAVENILLGRFDRVLFAPRGLHVDTSDPRHFVQVIDRSASFSSDSTGHR